MKFLVSKDEIQKGLKIIEHATMQKGLQPVLANVYLETIDRNTVKLKATDFDLTIFTNITVNVKELGKVTVSAKKLSDIVLKLDNDDLIDFETDENNLVKLTCKKTKFELKGISAQEFPNITEETEKEEYINIELLPLVKAIKQASFAAANFETNNLLSGVVCNVMNNMVEIASTDGNRLARAREVIDYKTEETNFLILPIKTIQEIERISSFTDDEFIRLYPQKNKIFIKTSNIILISRLLDGQYPKYNQLIPQKTPKEAIVDVNELINSIEKVSTMVSDKVGYIKLLFSNNSLKLTGQTPDSGKSEDEIDIEYEYEDLSISFNFRYLLECLKNMYSEKVKIGLNTELSVTVLKPVNEEDFVCLVMPVQIR